MQEKLNRKECFNYKLYKLNQIFMKLKKNLFFIMCTVVGTALFMSCSNDLETDTPEAKEQGSEYVDAQVLASYDEAELDNITKVLAESGIEVPESGETTKCFYTNQRKIVALKIQAGTNAAGGGRTVESGVLLLPSKETYNMNTTYRIHIAAPDNMFANEDVPSLIFANGISQYLPGGALNQYYFWVQKAMTGCIVFIPDYLGFGSSKGSSLTTYGNRTFVQSSMTDLVRAARNVLSANNYKYYADVTMTGYGYGGYVAAATARALEVDNAIPGVSVSKLVIADAPVNLTKTAELVLTNAAGTTPYLLPAILLGNYNAREISQAMLTQALKSPYNTSVHPIFNDNNGIITLNNAFPSSIYDLYTNEFIYDFGSFSPAVNSNILAITTALSNSDIQPWRRTTTTKIIVSNNTSNGFYPIVTKEFATKMINLSSRYYVTMETTTNSKVSFQRYIQSCL